MNLVPFTVPHITETYIGWLNDKTLMRYSENRHRSHNAITACGYFADMMRAGNKFWAVMDGDRHVGNVTAYLDKNNGVADLSILIGEPKKGYGLQAWKLGIERVFAETEMRKIEAGTMSQNLAMLKIFDQSGMTVEGRRLRHFFMAGWESADLVYAGKFRGQ